jgi:hypothetical protein
MISFRLTEEEHVRFRELCFARGIRSVSEMARAALNMLLQQQPSPDSDQALESRVSELEGRLHLLSVEVRRLAQPPATSRPPRLMSPVPDRGQNPAPTS